MEKQKIIKNICPCCEQGVLEKLEIPLELKFLERPGFESWGCLKCGQSFWKKIEIDT